MSTKKDSKTTSGDTILPKPADLSPSWANLYFLYSNKGYSFGPQSGNLIDAVGSPAYLYRGSDNQFRVFDEGTFKQFVYSMPISEINKYRAALVKAGYNIAPSGQVDATFYQALSQAQTDYSVAIASQFNLLLGNAAAGQTAKVKAPGNLITYLKSAPGAGAAGGTTYSKSISSKYQSDNLLNDTMQNLLGRAATAAEKKDFLSKLNAQQKKIFTKTTTTSGGTTVTASDFDENRFASNYVLSKINNSQDLSGAAGTAQDVVDRLAYDNGVSNVLDSNLRDNLVRRLASGKDNQTQVEAKINALAKITYRNWLDAAGPDSPLTIREIASPYISTYANMMGVDANTVDVSKVLNMATVNGTPVTPYDFKKIVRKDPKFQMTDQAHYEAASFGQSFARAMGVHI